MLLSFLFGAGDLKSIADKGNSIVLIGWKTATEASRHLVSTPAPHLSAIGGKATLKKVPALGFKAGSQVSRYLTSMIAAAAHVAPGRRFMGLPRRSHCRGNSMSSRVGSTSLHKQASYVAGYGFACDFRLLLQGKEGVQDVSERSLGERR